MKRLFEELGKQDDLEIGTIVRNGEPVDVVSLYEAKETVDYVVESFKFIPNVIETATVINNSLSQDNYLVTLEAYQPLLIQLKQNLGSTAPIPSLESYTNEYTAKSSREVALESVKDVFKRIWESIRKFFAAFFKKVNEFVKRLMNANLEIDTYERYVPDLLKKIRDKKLTLLDSKTEVDSKLNDLLAPEGIDKLNAVWVVNNTPLIIGSILKTHVHLFAKGLPEMDKHFKAITGKLEELSSVKDMTDDMQAINKVQVIKDDLINLIRQVVVSLCPNQIEPKDLNDETYDAIATLSTSSNLKDLTLFSLSDNKNNYTRLPKDFNLIIGASPEDKIYAVSSKDTDNTKSTAIEALPDLTALDRVYEQYKRLTKDFDIKKLTKQFDTTNQEVNVLLNKTARTLETMNDFLYKGLTKKVSSGIDVDKLDSDGKSDILSACARLEEIYEDLGRSDEVNRSTIEFAVQSNSGTTDDILRCIAIIEKYYVEKPDAQKRARERNEHNLFERAVEAYRGTAGTRSISPDTLASIREEVTNIERMCVNLAQNIQIALSSVQVGYPKLVTELRYSLLKYVYDSARKFE